jgi:CSLREA domain-containing protein
MTHLNFTKMLHLFVVAALVAGLALSVGPVQPAHAASFTVSTTLDGTDTNPGDGVCRTILNRCTLRAAIQEANALAGTDTITLPAGTYTLTRAGDDDTALNGDLDITAALILNGAGAASTIIDANDLDRIFHITGAFKVTISSLTIRDGTDFNSFGGSGLLNSGGVLALNNVTLSENSTAGDGGGLYNLGGTAKLNSVTVVNNSASQGGGGIENTGTLTMTYSTVSGNSTGTAGGGGIANAHGVITITFSTLSNNAATNSGGGGLSSVGGVIAISNSTVSTNTASTGAGGISVGLSNSTLALVNSTVSGNMGGGISVGAGGTATLASVTIVGNTGLSAGSGISNSGGVVKFKNTLIAGNGAFSDCAGILESFAYNLIQNADGCTVTGDTTGNLLGVAPGLLSPLGFEFHTWGDFGSPSPTMMHMISSGSPVEDAANPAGCTDFNGVFLSTDQRGPGNYHSRHYSYGGAGRCDIGAVEINMDL